MPKIRPPKHSLHARINRKYFLLATSEARVDQYESTLPKIVGKALALKKLIKKLKMWATTILSKITAHSSHLLDSGELLQIESQGASLA